MTQTGRLVRRTTKNKIGVVTVVIPKRFATHLGLDEPTEITIKQQGNCIIIQKLESTQ